MKCSGFLSGFPEAKGIFMHIDTIHDKIFTVLHQTKLSHAPLLEQKNHLSRTELVLNYISVTP